MTTSARPKNPAAPPAAVPKVLQVLPALNDGGVEQSALDMAAYLARKGVHQAVASAGGRKEAQLAAIGVAHVTLPLDKKAPWWVLWNAWRLRRYMVREGITLVHARSRGPAWSAWLASRGLAGVGYLTTFHGTYGHGNALKRWYNRVMLQGPVVIANSDFIKRHIGEVYGYPVERIVVAARGIDPAVFDPARFDATTKAALRAELGLAAGVPVIMTVGRLTRWKGVHVLLEALSQLKDLRWQAVVVGGADARGAYARQLRDQAVALGISDRVIFAGSRQDVAALWTLADIGVSSTIEPEAFGRMAVEAQAMGVPVVASSLGGSNETVVNGETGYLIAPNAPHPLGERLRNLLTQRDELPRLAAKTRPWVLKTFTTEHCCKQEESAYRRILGTG